MNRRFPTMFHTHTDRHRDRAQPLRRAAHGQQLRQHRRHPVRPQRRLLRGPRQGRLRPHHHRVHRRIRAAKGGPRKPCLFDDAVIPSFKAVADRCHAYGAKVSIQLQHAGPEGNSKLTGYPLKAASAIAPSAGREIPEAMPTEEVYRLIECYGDAARRAQSGRHRHGRGPLRPTAIS